jgi:glycosyltransferase involved in cell wall biosynthesis
MVKTPQKISFCITCKGRLEHLKKTLPENLKNTADYPNVEFVVLDYGSEDGLADWIEQHYQAEMDSGKIRYARFEPAPHFHMAHAKNMAHRVATGDILCNLDADNFIPSGFVNWLDEQFSYNSDIVVRPPWKFFLRRLVEKGKLDDQGIGGKIAIHKNNFMKLKGYDERIAGWAQDDCNFEARARQSGLQRVDVPNTLRGHVIEHTDEERIKHMAPDVQESSRIILQNSKSLSGRTKRKLGKILHGEMADGPLLPAANTDGHFGCGKVCINFRDEETLEPVQTPSIMPEVHERTTRWTSAIDKVPGKIQVT